MSEFTDWITIALTTAGGSFALYQYLRNSRLAREEQQRQGALRAADEMEKFDQDLRVRSALRMIDWLDTKVDVFFTGRDDEIFVDRNKFCSALRYYNISESADPAVAGEDTVPKAEPGSEDDCGFSDEEQAIRDVFDAFLSRLERIETLIESGVIPERIFSQYFSYWLGLLDQNGPIGGAPSHVPQWKRDAFWGYVEAYQFRNVGNLFARYGAIMRSLAR